MFLTANMLKALIAKALSKHFHSRGYMERMQKAVRQVGAPPESCTSRVHTCVHMLSLCSRGKAWSACRTPCAACESRT